MADGMLQTKFEEILSNIAWLQEENTSFKEHMALVKQMVQEMKAMLEEHCQMQTGSPARNFNVDSRKPNQEKTHNKDDEKTSKRELEASESVD